MTNFEAGESANRICQVSAETPVAETDSTSQETIKIDEKIGAIALTSDILPYASATEYIPIKPRTEPIDLLSQGV